MWVAAAVHVFVMVEGDLGGEVEYRAAPVREQPVADLGVRLDDSPLFGCERPGPGQNPCGTAILPMSWNGLASTSTAHRSAEMSSWAATAATSCSFACRGSRSRRFAAPPPPPAGTALSGREAAHSRRSTSLFPRSAECCLLSLSRSRFRDRNPRPG